MIVADVNLIAYLWIPGELTGLAERALRKDSDWVAPQLWRSEFRSVLSRYLRNDLISSEVMHRCLAGAESQIKTYSIPSVRVMDVVGRSSCSAYDCEYVALAESLDVKLITADKRICREFPEVAVRLKDYVA